ncbi:MAG: hypothetical protein DRZ76_03900 [Candidatus Nealsonbacteria bacterium]|nr:MAG: hypothetical protein DRZ76_03900 [Candidatus Nealsonbacteria bacterium]
MIHKHKKISLLATCLLIVFTLVGLFAFVNQAEATHINPVGEQTDYRWRNDDGTESSATWKALVNTPITGVNDLDEMRIRIAVEETAGGNLKLDSQLEFGTNADCTSGTWTLISTSSSTWQLFDSSQFTEPVATVQRISSASFLAGQLLDQTNPGAQRTISSQVTEFEWAIKANGVAASTDYYFRISDKGTALSTYTVCAKLTTAAAAGPSVTAPSSVAMDDYTLGTPAGYSEYTFSTSEYVTVTNSGSSGWTLTVSSTDMTGTNNTIPNTQIYLRTDGTLGTSPTIITSGDSLTGVTETASGTYSLDSIRTIVTASSGNGIGTYNIRPTIRVDIENWRYAEQDTATLTFTVS